MIDEEGLRDTLLRGILWSLLIFFLTFSLGFGLAYISCKGWIISVPVTVILLAVIFIIVLILGKQQEWNIPKILLLFGVLSGLILCFIHASMNVQALSADLWAIYISVCFVIGFIVDYVYTTYISE